MRRSKENSVISQNIQERQIKVLFTECREEMMFNNKISRLGKTFLEENIELALVNLVMSVFACKYNHSYENTEIDKKTLR